MTRGNRHDERGWKRTRGQRPRTLSVSLTARGQTTQDFAVGIGIFLLAIAFVFAYVPSLTTPFDSSVGGAETAQADRIADRLVYDLTEANAAPNEINASRLVDGEYADEDALPELLGLRTSGDGVDFDRANVSLETFDGTVVEDEDDNELATGPNYENQSAASAARIVTVDTDEIALKSDHRDETAFRLVVRVW